MVEKISRETLQEKVYESIKDSIVKNELVPGDVLSIDALAEDLGVSPTPVREALAKLSARGLVKDARNKKARIAPISEEDVLQTYEVRKLLEPYAMRLAAEKIGEKPDLKAMLEDLKQIAVETQQTEEEGQLDSSQYDRYARIDLELQEIVEDALGETLLSKCLGQVSNHSLQIRFFAESNPNGYASEVIFANNEEHLEIINNILDDDPEGTEQAVRSHLENAENRTHVALKNHPED